MAYKIDGMEIVSREDYTNYEWVEMREANSSEPYLIKGALRIPASRLRAIVEYDEWIKALKRTGGLDGI